MARELRLAGHLRMRDSSGRMGLLDRFRKPTPPSTTAPPRGASGRGHTEGFLAYEEFNEDLKHPYGHAIFDEMYRSDGDVRQVVQLVCNPATTGTWSVIPYGGEIADEKAREVAEFVRWALFEAMRPNLLGHLQSVLPVLARSGIAPCEEVWMKTEYEPKPPIGSDGEKKKAGPKRDVVVLRTLGLRLPRTITKFEQDKFGELTRIKQELPTPISALVQKEGRFNNPFQNAGGNDVWLDARNLVYYRLGAEGDNWEGVSLLRPAYKHWKYKDIIEKIDAIAQEREALGVPICYPPMGADSTQLDEVENVLASMRANEQAYIVAPGPKASAGAPEGQGWLFEVIGYERTGSGRDPQPSLEYHTQKIAAAFISEFMRLGHGQTGARATAQVQADPFMQSVEAFVSIVEQLLNDTLVAKLVAYNFPDVSNPPRLRMSLVDSTSLAQLAEYILKLSQAGAMLPDQELEDFLRARADLPAVNPDALAQRKGKDAETRRLIQSGFTSPDQADKSNEQPSGGFDKYGANAKVGKHGAKGAGQAAQSGGGAASNRSDDTPADVTLSRELRWDELVVDFDLIDERMHECEYEAEHQVGNEVFDVAKRLCGPEGDGLGHLAGAHALSPMLLAFLSEQYNFGWDTAAEEIEAQRSAYGFDSRTLDRGARDRGTEHLVARANIAASRVLNDMREAALNADLIHGDPARTQAAAERAGAAALRRVGRDHGISAIQHGRHDAAVTLDADESNDVRIVGVRYSAVLDRNTCGPCSEADDGHVRALDDPVRLSRQPPNPHCESTASGVNKCRCIETYEVQPPENITMSLDAEMLPPFISRVAQHLMSRGMATDRAVHVASNIAKKYCATGRISWPGLRSIDPGTRTDACEAATIYG